MNWIRSRMKALFTVHSRFGSAISGHLRALQFEGRNSLHLWTEARINGMVCLPNGVVIRSSWPGLFTPKCLAPSLPYSTIQKPASGRLEVANRPDCRSRSASASCVNSTDGPGSFMYRAAQSREADEELCGYWTTKLRWNESRTLWSHDSIIYGK